MSTDMDTTADEGRPCHFCGDDATGTDSVTIDGSWVEIPTCTPCHWDAITTCPCGRVIRQTDGVRVGDTLNCRPCSHQDAAITREYIRAHAHDEHRDDFNERRR